MAIVLAISDGAVAHVDERDDDFLHASFLHGIGPTGDPAEMVTWARTGRVTR